MFIKIEVNHRDSGNYYMFECEEYTIERLENESAETWADHREIYTEYPLTSDRSVMYLDRSKQIFLQGCTVYVMNDRGKTIDRIYT